MIEAFVVTLLFITIIYLTVGLYMSAHVSPTPTYKKAPELTVERLNYLYHNDYDNFQTVKKDLEERGWKVIFISSESFN